MASMKPTEKADSLTTEELRSRLYQSFRSHGFVNSIKTQLRNSLLNELQQSGHRVCPTSSAAAGSEDTRQHRAVNWLVAEHLRRCQYDYTLSIFLPETNTDHKEFSLPDLLDYLRIRPESRLYRKLVASSSKTDQAKGFLWQLLCELCALHSTAKSTSYVQTEDHDGVYSRTIGEKMNSVDADFEARRGQISQISTVAVEERILAFQKQVEEQSRIELKKQLVQIRENELVQIRLDEKNACRQELEQSKRQLEQSYNSQLDALRKMEQASTERVQADQQMQSKDLYAQRQSLLEEIESLRQRESQAHHHAEISKREAELRDTQLKIHEDGVKKREGDVALREAEYSQRLQGDMDRFKLEEKNRYLERTQSLDMREVLIKDNEDRIAEIKKNAESLKSDLKEKTTQHLEAEARLQNLMDRELNATKENASMQARLLEMSDYSALREELVVLRHEVSSLKSRLSETSHLYDRERTRYEEILRERTMYGHMTASLGQSSMEGPQKIESRINDELLHGQGLNQRLETQTTQQQQMRRDMEDLRQQLLATQQALHTEMHTRGAPPKTNLDITIPDFKSQGFRSPKIHQSLQYLDIESDTGSPPAVHPMALHFTDDLEIGDVPGLETGPLSPDVIAESRYRLKALEREAESLEKTYLDFQWRLSCPTLSPRQTKSKAHPQILKQTQQKSPPRALQQRPVEASSMASRRQFFELPDDQFALLDGLLQANESSTSSWEEAEKTQLETVNVNSFVPLEPFANDLLRMSTEQEKQQSKQSGEELTPNDSALSQQNSKVIKKFGIQAVQTTTDRIMGESTIATVQTPSDSKISLSSGLSKNASIGSVTAMVSSKTDPAMASSSIPHMTGDGSAGDGMSLPVLTDASLAQQIGGSPLSEYSIDSQIPTSGTYFYTSSNYDHQYPTTSTVGPQMIGTTVSEIFSSGQPNSQVKLQKEKEKQNALSSDLDIESTEGDNYVPIQMADPTSDRPQKSSYLESLHGSTTALGVHNTSSTALPPIGNRTTSLFTTWSQEATGQDAPSIEQWSTALGSNSSTQDIHVTHISEAAVTQKSMFSRQKGVSSFETPSIEEDLDYSSILGQGQISGMSSVTLPTVITGAVSQSSPNKELLGVTTEEHPEEAREDDYLSVSSDGEDSDHIHKPVAGSPDIENIVPVGVSLDDAWKSYTESKEKPEATGMDSDMYLSSNTVVDKSTADQPIGKVDESEHIDPVMKHYMDLVEKQRTDNQEQVKSGTKLDERHSSAAEEISIAEEVHSVNDSKSEAWDDW